MAKKKVEPEDATQEVSALERTIVNKHCEAIMGEFEDAINAARIRVEQALSTLFILARKYDVNVESQAVRATEDSLVINVRFQVNPEHIKNRERWTATKNFLESVRK
uniref:Uncharacterized protein n=1 Tax=viral metagenome TaxID=1070528 RepID=A0A6M3L7B3_9ZZZZ